MSANLYGFSGIHGQCEACGRCREQQARNPGLAVAGEVASLRPAGSGARPGRRMARAVRRPTLLRPGASVQPRHAAPAETESCVRGFLTSCAITSSRPYTPSMWRKYEFCVLRCGCSVVSCGPAEESGAWPTNSGEALRACRSGSATRVAEEIEGLAAPAVCGVVLRAGLRRVSRRRLPSACVRRDESEGARQDGVAVAHALQRQPAFPGP